MNTFGELLRLTTFGESHGPALGMVLDGCPSGVDLGVALLQAALDRRRPGQSELTSSRAEPDAVELLSGVYEGKTLGTPIAALVRNQDARASDGANAQARPGHADQVWRHRFGHADPRGGGRTSGRETVSRVLGGVVAEALLRRELPEVRIIAWVSGVGSLEAPVPLPTLRREDVDRHPTRCPSAEVAEQMAAAILEAKRAGDSLGGTIDVRVTGLPVGLGEPVFGKLKARLAAAYASVGTVAGVLFGPGDLPERISQPGTRFHADAAAYGGIQGGLSNGAPLEARLFHKPIATLGRRALEGRHDPCVLPRVVPVHEAMTALVLADLWLHLRARPHQP